MAASSSGPDMFQYLDSLDSVSRPRKRRHEQPVSAYDTIMQHAAGPASTPFPDGIACEVDGNYLSALREAGDHVMLQLMEAMQGPYYKIEDAVMLTGRPVYKQPKLLDDRLALILFYHDELNGNSNGWWVGDRFWESAVMKATRRATAYCYLGPEEVSWDEHSAELFNCCYCPPDNELTNPHIHFYNLSTFYANRHARLYDERQQLHTTLARVREVVSLAEARVVDLSEQVRVARADAAEQRERAEAAEQRVGAISGAAEQRVDAISGAAEQREGAPGGRGGWMKKAGRLIFHIWREEWDLARTHASDYYNYSPIVQQEYRKLLREAE